MKLTFTILTFLLVLGTIDYVHSVAASRSRDRRAAGDNPEEDEDDEDDDDDDEESNDKTEGDTKTKNGSQGTSKKTHRTKKPLRRFRVNLNRSQYRDMIRRLRKHLNKSRPQKTFILNNKYSQNTKRKMKPSKKPTPKRVLRYRNVHHTNGHRYRNLYKQRRKQHKKSSNKVQKGASEPKLKTPAKRRIISTRYGFQYAPAEPENKIKKVASINQVQKKGQPVDYTANNIKNMPVVLQSPSSHQGKHTVKSADVVTSSRKSSTNDLSSFLHRRQFLAHSNVVVSKPNQRKPWNSSYQSKQNDDEKNKQIKTKTRVIGMLSTPTMSAQTNTFSISSAKDAYTVKTKPNMQTQKGSPTSGTPVTFENKSKLSESQTSKIAPSPSKSAIHSQSEANSQISSDVPAVNSSKGQSARLMASQSEWVDPAEDSAGKVVIDTWKAVVIGDNDSSYGSQPFFNSQNNVPKTGQNTVNDLSVQTAQGTTYNSFGTVSMNMKAQDKHQEFAKDFVSTLSGRQDNNLKKETAKNTQGRPSVAMSLVTTGSEVPTVDKSASAKSYGAENTRSGSTTSYSMRNSESSISSGGKDGIATSAGKRANDGWAIPSETMQFSGWPNNVASLDNTLGSVSVRKTNDVSQGPGNKYTGGLAIQRFGAFNTGNIGNTQGKSPDPFPQNAPINSAMMISTSEVKETPTIVSKIEFPNIDISRTQENKLLGKQDLVKSSGDSVNYSGGSLSSVGNRGGIYNLEIVNSASVGSLQAGGVPLLPDKASIQSTSKSANREPLGLKAASSVINTGSVAGHEATSGSSASNKMLNAGGPVVVHQGTSGSLTPNTVPNAGGSVAVHDATYGTLASNTLLNSGASALNAINKGAVGSLTVNNMFNADKELINTGSFANKLDSVASDSLSDLVHTRSDSSTFGSSFTRAESTIVDKSTKKMQTIPPEQKIISVPLEISEKYSLQHLSNYNRESSSAVNKRVNTNNRKQLHFGTVPAIKVEPIVKKQNDHATIGLKVSGLESSSNTASLSGSRSGQSAALPRTVTSPKFDFIRPSDSVSSSKSSNVVSRHSTSNKVNTPSTVPQIRVAVSKITKTDPIADVQNLYNELGGRLPELNKARFKVGIVDFHLSPEEKRTLKSISRTSTSIQSGNQYSPQSHPVQDSVWSSGSVSAADISVTSGQDSFVVPMLHAGNKNANEKAGSDGHRAEEFAQSLSSTASQQRNTVKSMSNAVGTADKVISSSLSSYHSGFPRDMSKLTNIESDNKLNSQDLHISTSNVKGSDSNQVSNRISPKTGNKKRIAVVNTHIVATYTKPQAAEKPNDNAFESKTNNKMGLNIQNTGFQTDALYNHDESSSRTSSVTSQTSRILHSSSSSNLASRASSSSSSGLSLNRRHNQFLSGAVRSLDTPMLSEFNGPDMHAYRSRVFVNTLHKTPSKMQNKIKHKVVTKTPESTVDSKYINTQLSSGLLANDLTAAATKGGTVIATSILKKKPDESENDVIIPVVNNDISSLSRGIIIGDTSLKSLSGRDGPYDRSPKKAKVSARRSDSTSRLSPMNGIVSGDSSVISLNGVNMFHPTAAPVTPAVKKQVISRPGSNAKGFSILWMAGQGYLNRRTGLLETPGGPITQFAGAGKDPNEMIPTRRKFRRHGGMAFAVGDAALKGLSGGAVVDIGGGGFRQSKNHKDIERDRIMRQNIQPRLNIDPVNVPAIGDSSLNSLSLRRMPNARMQSRLAYSPFNQRHIISSVDQRNKRFRFSVG